MPGHRPDPSLAKGFDGTCPACGKRTYRSRARARARARAMPPSGHMIAYQCRAGGEGWHLGHLPRAVRNGQLTKDDYEGRTR